MTLIPKMSTSQDVRRYIASITALWIIVTAEAGCLGQYDNDCGCCQCCAGPTINGKCVGVCVGGCPVSNCAPLCGGITVGQVIDGSRKLAEAVAGVGTLKQILVDAFGDPAAPSTGDIIDSIQAVEFVDDNTIVFRNGNGGVAVDKCSGAARKFVTQSLDGRLGG